MKSSLLLSLWLTLAVAGVAAAQTAEAPADMISNFRRQHGEGPVTLDATLTRIARDQAAAMAARDVLDHDVLGKFSSRVAPSNAGRAAENIAYGYDSFPKTLKQWIDSSEHRKNLLLPKASRFGIASVKSSATGRTYWAMEIAGDYERPQPKNAKPIAVARDPVTREKPGQQADAKSSAKPSAAKSCRLKILSLCL